MSQSTLLSTLTFPEFTDLVIKTFAVQSALVTPAVAPLYILDPVGKNAGNTKRYDEVDTQTFARIKRQAENTKKASVGKGYYVTLTKKRIGIEIDIAQEMLDENRTPEINTKLTNLAHFGPQRIELDGTHLLTFSSATAYTDMDGESNTISVGDGYALVYSAHTLKFSSLTYSNRVSGDPLFSQGGLEAAELLATTDVMNNFGERRVKNFNVIITGDDPNTVNAVKKVLASMADPDGAHSGVLNVNKGKYRHIILPYLSTTATGARDSTKAKWWFLAAVGQGQNGWQAYYAEYEAPHLKTPNGGNNEDYSADVWTYGTRAGYGFRAVSGIGLIGSLPTS